ncbi:MAG: UvrD-helicase domain-containing protein [Anaerolineae bacterium]|nr:UvrD-helicase domain-containing protein [Anaerolineae bacterium]MDW8097864.1 UvrD-helicase domain-containing protein [Anaerolineae bacterium]
MDDFLASLNEQQRLAVTAGHGPVLVLAGPGSGKTRVLTHRIAWLVAWQRLDPWRIIAVTFTNKAAREMRGRVEQLLGADWHGLTLGTFHSICARILRREGHHLGIPSNFTIFDEEDQAKVIKQALKDLNLDDKRFPPSSVHAVISRAKNELILPEDYIPRTYWEEAVGRAYWRYQELLRASHALDFDDLLLQAVLLFRQVAEVRERYQERYKHILVDEFQDTNSAQYELVRLLSRRWRSVFVVGDEDQSIYRWRGADYRNVMRFREDFPDAQTILLEKNYRSTQIILDAANAVIACNSHRMPKRLHTDRTTGPRIAVYEASNESDEAAYVVSQIRRLTEAGEVALGDCAVMYRTNAQSRALEEVFVAAGMPYRLVGATRFYERREIKDLLAYLRLIYNPNDSLSLARIINVPPRKIGDQTLARLADWARELGLSQMEALRRLSEGEKGPFTAGARASLLSFFRMLQGWIQARPYLTPVQLLDRVLAESGYAEYVRDGTEEGEDRWANIQELRNVASQYSVSGTAADSEDEVDALGLFLQEIALVSDVDELPEKTDVPTLLTLHMAKGLEFSAVFITGLEEGLLPHSRSLDDPEELEEERRLFYVGITRAKEHLFLTYTLHRLAYGSNKIRERSRFLGDIPPSLMEGDYLRERQTAWRRKVTWDSNGWGPNVAWSPGQEAMSPTEEMRHPRFAPGDRVRHAQFGEGVVIHALLIRDEEEVTVAFEGRGIKRLLGSYLEKLAG